MKILIIGAGYIGLPLALELKKRGDEPTGWVATRKSRRMVEEAGIPAICADAADEKAWKKHGRGWDAMVYCVSSSRGGAEVYQKVFGRGLELALQHRIGSFIYTSSTSVYAQTDGSVVDEASPTEPTSETGRILVQAEQKTLSAGGTVARLAGIYGPGRGVLFQKVINGAAVMDRDRWINQVHRDDVVHSLLFLLERQEAGCFNVCDDEPVLLSEFYRWVCEKFGKPFPPSASAGANRKRPLTNKRVSNAKLRRLGYVFRHPSFREGYVMG